MRKLIFAAGILLTVIALGACAQRTPSTAPTSPSQAGNSTPVPVKTPYELPTKPPASSVEPPLDLSPILAFLASQLNLPVEQVTLTSWQPVEWRDACLGVHRPNEGCADVITPGFVLTFHAGQADYAVNTDATGKNFRLAQKPESPAGLPAISWTRSGGFAGVCQNLTVYYTGSYWLRDCKAAKTLAQGVLPEGHLTYLSGLWERFGSFDWTPFLPPGSADMFIDQINFYSKGRETMTADEQEKVNAYLAQLANELAGSEQGASGIAGQVLIGPTCGGPVKAGSNECADKPYPTTITVLDQAGQVVTRITTDAAGRFSLPLPPGTYTLQPETSGRLPMAVEQVVTVVSGQFLTLTITYDSGMR